MISKAFIGIRQNFKYTFTEAIISSRQVLSTKYSERISLFGAFEAARPAASCAQDSEVLFRQTMSIRLPPLLLTPDLQAE